MSRASATVCRKIELEAAPEQLREIRGFMDEISQQAGLDPERAFDLKVAVSEACANAVEHSAGEESPLEICATVHPDRVVVEISDGGDFRLAGRGPDRGSERGLGLPLMVALMDEVRFYKRSGKGTTVALSLFLEPPDEDGRSVFD
jgi:serine/threonine-protein kinase RsbW